MTIAYLKSALEETLILPEEVTATHIAKFNLPELNLSFKGLERLPSEVGSLTQLQNLELFGNKLSDLPYAISNLTKLRTLGL